MAAFVKGGAEILPNPFGKGHFPEGRPQLNAPAEWPHRSALISLVMQSTNDLSGFWTQSPSGPGRPPRIFLLNFFTK